MLLFVTDLPRVVRRGVSAGDDRYGVVGAIRSAESGRLSLWRRRREGVGRELRAGAMNVSICTDFKRRGGAPFKRFSVEGVADRRAVPHRVDLRRVVRADPFQRAMRCRSVAPGSRHQDIIRQSWRWHRQRSNGLRPDADFAWLVFGLSAALWASCHEGREIQIDTEAELQETMQRYPDSRRQAVPLPGSTVARTG